MSQFYWLDFLGLVCVILRRICFGWSSSTLLGGQSSWLILVLVPMKLSALVPRLQFVYCAATLCSLPACKVVPVLN
jgi:hypothetical protein